MGQGSGEAGGGGVRSGGVEGSEDGVGGERRWRWGAV